MKGKLILLFLFSLLITQARAQEEKWYPVLSLQQYPGSPLDLRISNMHVVRVGDFAAYCNNINMVIRQDYSNPSRYVVSLNPAIWAGEYVITNLLWKNDSTGFRWTNGIPMAIVMADILANMRLDIYWVYIGWNTDFYVYDKKFCVVFDATFALKYEFERVGFYAGIKGPAGDLLKFMAPYEKDDGQFILGLIYKFDNNPVSEFIGLRGRSWQP